MLTLKNSGVTQTINQIFYNAQVCYGIIPTVTKIEFLNWIKGLRSELMEIVVNLDELYHQLQDPPNPE